MRRRAALATIGAAVTGGCLRLTGSDEASATPTAATGETGTAAAASSGERPTADVWVAPDGESGDGSRSAPFTNVRRAFEAVEPGDTLFFQSGEYRLNGRTLVGGEPDAPIEITGPPDAVLRAREAAGPVLGIVHSHVHLTGTTLDGLADPSRKWETPDVWADSVVEVSPGPRYESAGVEYLEDVVVEPHAIRNSGSAFVLLERTRDAAIGGFEVTGPAGAEFHPEMADPVESHVGNLIQIGASTKTIAEYKPWDGLDRTRNVRIHHVNNAAGHHHSSFAQIHVGAEAITVEYCTDRNAGNETTGKKWVPSVAVAGNNCTVRGNDFGDSRQGVVFSAWTPEGIAEASNWARNNDVYTNRLQRLSAAPFVFDESSPDAQRTFCDNRLVGIDGSYDYATGECSTDVAAVDGIGHTAGRDGE
ncbi:hypothetical protein RYH80_04055 [Halobaculum sp. MBLA0147]|uniref:hypothetical protein n=1 Tax=Halobaculum sp. MBLA0147 TaxID=3079934 RepID=UPI00352395FE